MVRWAFILLVAVAVLAAFSGLAEIASGAPGIGKSLFCLFLFCFVMFFVTGLAGDRRRRLLVVQERSAQGPAKR